MKGSGYLPTAPLCLCLLMCSFITASFQTIFVFKQGEQCGMNEQLFSISLPPSLHAKSVYPFVCNPNPAEGRVNHFSLGFPKEHFSGHERLPNIHQSLCKTGKWYTCRCVGKELRHTREAKSAHQFSEPNSIYPGHDYPWYLALYTALCIQHTALVE